MRARFAAGRMAGALALATAALAGSGTLTVAVNGSPGSLSSSALDIGSGLTIRVGDSAFLSSSNAFVNHGYVVGGWADFTDCPILSGDTFSNPGTIEARGG